MGNIYDRLSKLEDFRDENPYPSNYEFNGKTQQNRIASPSQALLINEMYTATPHLRDVDNLLRRIRKERVCHIHFRTVLMILLVSRL